MAETTRENLEERVRRYRALLRLHTDPMTRKALEEIIREMEARLSGDSTPRLWC